MQRLEPVGQTESSPYDEGNSEGLGLRRWYLTRRAVWGIMGMNVESLTRVLEGRGSPDDRDLRSIVDLPFYVQGGDAHGRK